MTSPVASAEIDLPRAATSWLLVAEAKYTLDTKVAADCRIRWAALLDRHPLYQGSSYDPVSGAFAAPGRPAPPSRDRQHHRRLLLRRRQVPGCRGRAAEEEQRRLAPVLGPQASRPAATASRVPGVPEHGNGLCHHL
jgi:hypothetical protein